MKPLLVGELNPYGDDDHFALYPRPRYASGHRLCDKVMGLKEADYLERFDRINLCYRRFSVPEARKRAAEILVARVGGVLVLCGAKVAAAFGFTYEPFSVLRLEHGCAHGYIFASPCPPARKTTVVVLPHPSGLCRTWNEPGAYDNARAALRAGGVL